MLRPSGDGTAEVYAPHTDLGKPVIFEDSSAARMSLRVPLIPPLPRS